MWGRRRRVFFPLVHSKLAPYFFYFRHKWLFHIYYCFFIILTTIKHWWSGWCVDQWAMGPGFESHVPPNAYYYFDPGNPMQSQRTWTIMLLLISNARWPSSQIQRPGLKVHHTSRSTYAWVIQKVKAGWSILGLEIANHTLKSGPTPPIFGYFFSYFFFLFNCFY